MGWIYTATFYTAQDVSGRFCPWCIANGSVAERFAGDFTDSYGLDGVSEDVLHEVTRRTPRFHAWQDPHWLAHCQDAAAFLGESDTPSWRRIPKHWTSCGPTCASTAGTTKADSNTS